MIDTLFELSVEEKLARIDTALDSNRQALDDAQARFEAETAQVRQNIEALLTKREELAPATNDVAETVDEG